MEKINPDTKLILVGLTGVAALVPALMEALPMALRVALLLIAVALFAAYAVLYLRDPRNRRPRRGRRS